MLDFIKNLFKKEFQLNNISVITGYLGNIVKLLEVEYLNDGNAKNAAIDAVIQLLEEQKTPPVVPPTQPVVPPTI
jgi:RNA binding exosome subunit